MAFCDCPGKTHQTRESKWAEESKRAETISFRPFFSFSPTPAMARHFRWGPLASALPRRLGFVDRFLMIPAATADGLIHRQRAVVSGFGLGVAAAAESRATPGRELIDLGRSVIQTCVHTTLHESNRFSSMVRSTRSRVVTELDIARAVANAM
jgi:hypothetical protein